MLGSDAWHLTEIVNFVPLLILLSVFFFILGLFLYIISLHQVPSWVFITVSGAAVIIYIATLLISIVDCQSPFRSTISRIGYYIYIRFRVYVSPKSSHWEKEGHSSLFQTNEKREQMHAKHSNIVMAVFQRLSNILEVAPRNWHRFYSIAEQLVSDSVEDQKAELTKHKSWVNLLSKIESGLTDKDGRGLVFLAAEKADQNMLALLQKIPAVYSKDKRGFTPLHAAAEKGNDIGWILENMKELHPDAKDLFGQTPLSLAASNGHAEIVRQLLS
jgi:hypothetical protein